MRKNREITGKYLGYFTSELFVRGSNYFRFTHHEHVSLIETPTGVVCKKGVDRSFQIYVAVTINKQKLVRSLIESKDLIMVEFKEGELYEVYELNSLGICSIPS